MRSAATPEDLAHFAAIRAAEETAEEERFQRAAETPPGNGCSPACASERGHGAHATGSAEIDARTDGQMELARRRIALGLTSKSPPPRT